MRMMTFITSEMPLKVLPGTCEGRDKCHCRDHGAPWGQGWVRFSGHALYLSSAVTGSALRPALGLDSLHFVSDRGSIVGTKILTNPHCFLVATTSAQLSCLWSRLRGGYFRMRIRRKTLKPSSKLHQNFKTFIEFTL